MSLFKRFRQVIKDSRADIKAMRKLNGKEFTAVIANHAVVGRIAVVDGLVYLCQDVVKGAKLNPKLQQGYKYVWFLGHHEKLTKEVVEFAIVKNLLIWDGKNYITIQECLTK